MRLRTQTIVETKFVTPILTLLSQGMSPDKIALSMAVACGIGAIPVLGVTSLLCLVVALVLGLNVAAMQAVSWMLTPLQLTLLLPFYRLGAWMFGVEPVPINPATMLTEFRADPLVFWSRVWQQMVAGTLLWFVVSIPAVWILFYVFRAVVARVTKRKTAGAAAVHVTADTN